MQLHYGIHSFSLLQLFSAQLLRNVWMSSLKLLVEILFILVVLETHFLLEVFYEVFVNLGYLHKEVEGVCYGEQVGQDEADEEEVNKEVR